MIVLPDDTTVIGLITDNDETAYRQGVQKSHTQCNDHNLALNIKKTMEIIDDYRKTRRIEHTLLLINEDAVERIDKRSDLPEKLL